jgi:HSP20 family protein
MPGLLKRDHRSVEPVEVFDRLDRLFGEWMGMFPFHRPFFDRGWSTERIRVDEYRENGELVVRAELPGIDPERDLELTVSDDMLHIEAERREEEKTETQGYVRHEIRYGSFQRWLALPEGVTESDVTATYKDGILEIHVATPTPELAKKIPISKT